METRSIGSLTVSVVGLGCNNFGTTFGTHVDEAGTAEVVTAALEAGINFFDTADIYGDSEVYLGKALASRRDEVVIATKFGGQIGSDPTHKGAGAKWIEQAVENSLQRLGTDRIDLYQLHFPDPETPLEETLSALDRLVTSGKVREIGSSNFSGDQIAEAAAIATEAGTTPFASAQNDLSLLRQRAADDVIPACERNGVAFIPFSPLASGLLTGKYERGQAPAEGTRLSNLPSEMQERSMSERTFDRLDRLRAFAEERGRTLTELAFAWLLAQPTLVSVIAGATRPDQVAANVASAGWRMTAEETAEAARLATG
jgi:aryl-alcohol dehydrogenase-like predicted oxidoreductase